MNQQSTPSKKGPLLIVSGKPEQDGAASKDFEQQGFEVHLLGNGQKALTIGDLKPAQWSPTMIIVDTVVPQMSGFELVRRLKQKWDHKNVPIVLMAEHPAQEDLLECTNCGALALIKKPLSWSALSQVIENERMRRLKGEIADLVFKINYD